MGWFAAEQRGLALGIRQTASRSAARSAPSLLPVACVERRHCDGVPRPRRGVPRRRSVAAVLLRGGAGATGDPAPAEVAPTAPRPAHVAARQGHSALPRRADRDDQLRRPVPARAPGPLDARRRGCAGRDQRPRHRRAHRLRADGPTGCGLACGRCESLASRSPRARRPWPRSSTRRSPCSSRRSRSPACSASPGTGSRSPRRQRPQARARSGAALGFQQTVLGVIVADRAARVRGARRGYLVARCVRALPRSAGARRPRAASGAVGYRSRAKTRNVGDPAGSSLNSGLTQPSSPPRCS